jgi:peptidyl-prolyl cis-trans isomerase D
MLKLMRDSFQHLKWILIAIVAAFIFGFVYFDMGLGGASASTRDQQKGYAARVNGETITTREFDRAVAMTEDQYKQMYKQQLTPEMLAALGVQKGVLDSLVDQKLLMQEARRLKLTATQEELQRRLLQIETLNPGGKWVGPELYARFCQQMGFASPAEFEDELGKQITLEKMESALQNTIVISPKAAEAEYRRVTENAKIRYVLYPAAREATNVTVTDADVDQYYKTHPDKYTHGEQRAVKYLVADVTRLRSAIHPSDAELLKRYEAAKEDYRQPESAHILHILIKVDPGAAPAVDAAARAKAESLVKQLRAGADFAALAKANSGDPSSSGKGGDMGFVKRGETVEPFDNAAFSIPLNTISDPIRSTEFGYHIIKVLERKSAGYRTFDEVKGQLSQQVADQQAKDQAREEVTRIMQRIQASKPKNANDFAKFANEKVVSSDTLWFGKSDPIPGLGNNQALSTWAFGAKEGDTGEIIGTNRGPAIPFLYGVRSAGVAPLKDIRDKVATDTRMEKSRQLATAALTRALPAPTVDALAAKVGLTPGETTVTRQGYVSGFTGDVTPLIDAAMKTPIGSMGGPIAVNEGAVVFSVTEQKKVDPKQLDENRTAYAEQLRQTEARSLRTSLLQRLKKSANIDINQQVIDQSSGRRPSES